MILFYLRHFTSLTTPDVEMAMRDSNELCNHILSITPLIERGDNIGARNVLIHISMILLFHTLKFGLYVRGNNEKNARFRFQNKYEHLNFNFLIFIEYRPKRS